MTLIKSSGTKERDANYELLVYKEKRVYKMFSDINSGN